MAEPKDQAPQGLNTTPANVSAIRAQKQLDTLRDIAVGTGKPMGMIIDPITKDPFYAPQERLIKSTPEYAKEVTRILDPLPETTVGTIQPNEKLAPIPNRSPLTPEERKARMTRPEKELLEMTEIQGAANRTGMTTKYYPSRGAGKNTGIIIAPRKA